MMNISFSAALEAARRRNPLIAAAYKEASRHLVSRAVASLAASAAEQRRQLSEELDALAAAMPPALANAMVELPDDLVSAAMAPIPAISDEAHVISFFRDVEEAERRIYSIFAESATAEADVAARLSAFAEQARKRASVAGDHLDLLGLR